MVDPVSTSAAVVKAAQALDPGVQEFAEQVTGAGRRELGEWIADHIRLRRWKTQLAILTKAKQYAHEAGFSPQAVPLKTLAPLLEGASLEEEGDEGMSDRWASLLANASSPGAVVPPSFPEILSQITSVEARLLDQVFQNAQNYPRTEWLTHGIQVEGNAQPLGMSAEESAVAAENLSRLGLCSPPAAAFGFIDHPERQFLIASGVDLICLTKFGAAFVEACRRPPRASGVQ